MKKTLKASLLVKGDKALMKVDILRDFVKKHGIYNSCADSEANIAIKYSESSLQFDFGDTRRPVFSLIGKPISKDDASNIIRLTDNYLHEFYMPKEYRRSNTITEIFNQYDVEPKNYVIQECFENNWFPKDSSTPYGWCHADGYIGLKHYIGRKNPTLDEMLFDWTSVISKVSKELDIVIAVTDLDEIIKQYDIFNDHIVVGLHIQGDTIEILSAVKARLLYKQYSEKYNSKKRINGNTINSDSLKSSITKKTDIKSDSLGLDDIKKFAQAFKEVQSKANNHT